MRNLRQFQFAALGIVLLTVVTRLPALLHPLAIDDEAAYSVAANVVLDGGRLYIDVIDRKAPLLFWTYAAIFKIAGKYNWVALHVVTLLWTLATMAGLYVFGRCLFNRNTGLIAALLYSVFQPWLDRRNLALNGELLMNLPIVWAWAIALGRSRSRLRPDLLVSGALLAVAFTLKQPAAIAAVPLGIYLLLPSYRGSRGLTPTQSVIQAALLTVGFFATLALAAIVLLRQGILHEAIYWTIAAHSPPHIFWTQGVLFTLAFIGACLPLLIGAALAFRDRDGVWLAKSAERTALFGLVAASCIGVAAAAHFNLHYYIQLIPPLALLAAPHYDRLWFAKTRARHWLLHPGVTYAWLALTVVVFSISHWVGQAKRRNLSGTERYLIEHSAPQDRVFVWGHGTSIYLYTQRQPASRYILTFPLTGHIFGGPLPGVDTRNRIVPGSWENLQQDFAKHPPAYIIDLYSRPGALYPVQQFPILAKLLAEHYQPVARTEDGVIYCRSDYRALAHHEPKSNR